MIEVEDWPEVLVAQATFWILDVRDGSRGRRMRAGWCVMPG